MRQIRPLLSLINHDYRFFFTYDVRSSEFVFYNPAFETFFSVNKDSEGPDPNDLFSRIHPDDQGFIKEIYKKLEIGDFKRDIEFRMIMEDSSIRCLRSTLYLEEDDCGSPMLSGYIEDISSLKSNEIKLKDLSNKKNAILNILSHDLAGPLGSIRHYTYVLNKKTKSLGDPLIPQIIASIEKISTRSIDMIQEFLKVEFMESVGVDLIKRRENLIEKLKPFVEEYQKSDKKLGKTFHFTCPDHPIYVDIDENKFIQVINNLVSNSLKFTQDGGKIELTVEDKGEHVLISVSDNGIGIPERYHATLFDKFCEARRPGLKGEPSVGLGMSLIKTIVDWHRGKINFESKENEGTTFYIEILKSKGASTPRIES